MSRKAPADKARTHSFSAAVSGLFWRFRECMATAPATIGRSETVIVPAELVAAFGPERLRKLHTALLRAVSCDHTVTVKVEPKHGRVVECVVVTESSL